MVFFNAIKSVFSRGEKSKKEITQPDVVLISFRDLNEDQFCFRSIPVRAKAPLPVPTQKVSQSEASQTISCHLTTVSPEPMCDTENDPMNDTTVKKTSPIKHDNTDYDNISCVSAEIVPIVVELPPTSGSCTILAECGTQTEMDEINELRAKVIYLEDLMRKNEQEKKEMVLRLNDHQIAAVSLEKEVLNRQTLFEKSCAKIESMQREVRGLYHKRSNLQTEIVNLKKELSDSKEKNGKKFKELDEIHCKNIEKLRAFHSILIKNRDETISDMTTNIHQLENENHEYMLQIENYEDQYREAVKELEQLSALSQTQKGEIHQLEEVNAKLKVQVEELEQSTLDLPNYYKMLNLDRDASDAQIKSAYRKQVLEFHPDKVKQLNPNSDDKFCERAKKFTQALNRAKRILQMPRLKYQYDAWLDMTELKKAEERQECYDRMYR